MKVENAGREEAIGINLIAESEEDEAILERFWNGGVKLNACTFRQDGSEVQLTFQDLVEEPVEEPRPAPRALVAGIRW